MRPGNRYGVFLSFCGVYLVSAMASAAGLEHPDNGAVAVGRAGAYAAAPEGPLALQYNPAGFASLDGFHVGLEAKLINQGIRYTPTSGQSVENTAPPFFAPAGAVSYGFGRVGPFSQVSIALGAFGPSAVGVVQYPSDGPQRYSLIESDYFMAFVSSAIAVAWRDWLQAGVTLQLMSGHAMFSKKVYAGMTPGTDAFFDATATVDVKGTKLATILGVTVRPLKQLAIGVSFRPAFNWQGDGTLETTMPATSARIGAIREGNEASLAVPFPAIVRAGVQYAFDFGLTVESDFVYEGWSVMQSIDVTPKNISVTSDNMAGEKKLLETMPVSRYYQDAFSVRVGAEYDIVPERLLVRGGYVFETSAAPDDVIGVDNANWGRHALGAGVSVAMFGAWLDIGYGHHFIPTKNVTNSRLRQSVTPCVMNPGCVDTEASVIGNGTYEGSFDVFAVSLRVPVGALSSTL